LGFDDDGCAWPKFCLKSIWPRWQQAVVRFNGAYVANFLNQTCHRREREPGSCNYQKILGTDGSENAVEHPQEPLLNLY
jgi:hypothetical protein